MRAILAVLVPLLLCAGNAARAQTPAPVLATPVAATPAPQATGTRAPAKGGKRARNGRAGRVAVADRQPGRATGSVEEALTSCLTMWEPATHMTKVQWARACRRVAERLRGV